MNGYAQITVSNKEGGQEVRHLYFGRQAVEEFGRRIAATFSDNSFKIATDMVFAGLVGYNTKMDIPPPLYTEVYEMMEEFTEQEDYEKQYEGVQKAFWESKYGREYQTKLADFKKKAEEELERMAQQETP